MNQFEFSLLGSKRANVPDGSHTENFILPFADQQCLAKVIGLDGKEDQFASASEVLQMALLVELYRTELTTRGIRVPTNLAYVTTVLNERHCLVELVPYMGNSLSILLEATKEWAFWECRLQAVLADVRRLLDHEHALSLLPVGLDPKPSNYVTNGESHLTLYYIDLVWPLSDGSLKCLVHPEVKPIWEFRYFNPLGILINVIVQFSRLAPEFRPQIVQTVTTFTQAVPDLCHAFMGLPNIRWAALTSAERLKAVDTLPEAQLDIIRDIGLQLLLEHNRTEDIKFVFEATRTNPRLALPTERLTTTREYLRTLLLA